MLAAVLFAVVVPVPILAVVVVKLFGLRGAVAAGIVLMAISPGAPVALRRAIQAGGGPQFAPTLHLAIVMFAVVTVPVSVMVMSLDFFGALRDLPARRGAPGVLRSAVAPGDRRGVARVAARDWLPDSSRGLPRLSNLMLLALIVLCLVVLGPRIVAIGWAPVIAGMGLTLCALFAGTIFAGRDASVRPAAAVAAAMRNPGLALLIATRNAAPPDVTASVFGYALGLAGVIFAFLAWRKWSYRGAVLEAASK